MLEVVSVSRTYPGGVRALVDVSFSIEAGETLAIIGESGCGKSTLLRMFNALEHPDQGTVRVFGRDVREQDPTALRRSIGYVPQAGGLLPHWTVERNVGLVPRLLGIPPDDVRERSRALLASVGLDPERFGDRYPNALSGGERQRVALARALAGEPELVLLDEPFGALDAITRVDVQDVFFEQKRRLGKTTVLVTHDLSVAFRLGDRVAVLRGGRLLQIADPDTLVASPADPYVRDLVSHQRVGAP